MAEGGSAAKGSAASILTDPDWFLSGYDPSEAMLEFVRSDRAALARQPFLDHRWDRRALPAARLPLADVAAAIGAPAAAAGPHMIWHSSFCCSTLITEALDRPGACLGLREPLALVPVADAKRAGMHGGPKMPPRLPEIVLRLFARRPRDGGAVVVKPSNFANVLVQDAARVTHGKALLLYSDLESFLISVAKSGTQLRKYARRLFGNIAGDPGAPLPWAPQEIFQMTDLEIAAIAWHLQIAEFRRAWNVLGPSRAASLDCDAFLVDPATALAKLDGFFGLGLGAAHISDVVSGPLLKRHAKQPAHPFDARRRREENAAVRGFLGADLARIVEWSYRACPGTPREVPLPGALIPIEKRYA